MRITRWTGALLLTIGAVACRDSQSPTAPVQDLPPVAALATEESGGVAFDHFVADATSHEWANSYLLSLLSHYAYVSLVGAADDAGFLAAFEAHFAPLGLGSFRMIEDPLTDTEVVIAQNDDAVFVIFRGTEADPAALEFELRDIYVDLAFVMINGIHDGFQAGSRRVIEQVAAELENAGDRKVWLTGHSLGGALATVTAHLLRTEHDVTVSGVYTYGAPRVFSEDIAATFDAAFGARSQRWVNDRDPVPHVAPVVPLLLPYRHVSVLNNIVPDNGACVVRRNDTEMLLTTPEELVSIVSRLDLADPASAATVFQAIFALGNLDDHDTARYASRIYARMPAELRAVLPEPPYPASAPTSCDGPQDLTPPVVEAEITGTSGNDGWYVSDVGIAWIVTDAESSIESSDGCEASVVAQDTDGITFTCTATSAGGTTAESVTIRRDATPPSGVTAAPDRLADHGGWYNAPFAVAWSGADATSGIAACTNASYDGPDTADGTLSGTCTDVAGNTSDVAAFGFRYDATAPVIAIASPAEPAPDFFRDQLVTAVFQCSDATAGMATCTGSTADGDVLPTDAFGAHELVVQAQDQAGNTSSASRAYTVTWAFDGFYPPVENLPAVNAARAGQRIPFKWNLRDSSGVVVPDRSDLFEITWSAPFACSATVGSSDLTATYADSNTGIRWDPIEQQYVFVAATSRADAGTCRYLNVDIGSHATASALVRFR